MAKRSCPLAKVYGLLEPGPKTIHHRGEVAFMVAGETIKLTSRMK